MVNIIITSDPRYKVNRNLIESTVLGSLKQHGVKGKIEVEVSIVGDRKMLELNKQYRGLDSTTDVLSFALEDPHPHGAEHRPRVKGFAAAPDKVLRLGSIIVSYPQTVENAAEEGKSVEEELIFLVDHGMNHLLGYHHD